MTTDPDMTAAEFVLGLLDGEERAAALRRMLADPGFAGEVEEWRERLSGLYDDYPEVAAPEGLADRLAASLSPAAPAPAPSRQGWGWAVAAVAIAAAVALVFLFRPSPPPPPHEAPHQVMVAALTSKDGATSLSALVDATSGEVRVPGTDIAPNGRSAELWLIGADGVPQAIGVLAERGPSRLALPAAQKAALKTGVTFAISIEPEGGSPTGQPTGPVVATGTLSAV